MREIDKRERKIISISSPALPFVLSRLIVELYYRTGEKYELTRRKIEYIMTIYELCYMKNHLQTTLNIFITENKNIYIDEVVRSMVYQEILDSSIKKNIKIKKSEFNLNNFKYLPNDLPVLYTSLFILSQNDIELLIDIICEFGNMEQRNLYDQWHEFVDIVEIDNNSFLPKLKIENAFENVIKTDNAIYNFVNSKEIYLSNDTMIIKDVKYEDSLNNNLLDKIKKT